MASCIPLYSTVLPQYLQCAIIDFTPSTIVSLSSNLSLPQLPQLINASFHSVFVCSILFHLRLVLQNINLLIIGNMVVYINLPIEINQTVEHTRQQTIKNGSL
jgi:hypothetical protein